MKKYCTKCGSPHEYTISPPNFCEKCGTNFNASIPSQNTTTQVVANSSKSNIVQQKFLEKLGLDDDTDDTPIPDISNLTIKTEVSAAAKLKISEAGVQIEGGQMLGGARGAGDCKTIEDYKRQMDSLFSKDVGTEIKPE